MYKTVSIFVLYKTLHTTFGRYDILTLKLRGKVFTTISDHPEQYSEISLGFPEIIDFEHIFLDSNKVSQENISNSVGREKNLIGSTV